MGGAAMVSVAPGRTGAAMIRDLIAAAARQLERAGVASARLDSELLLAAAAGVDRAQVIAGTVEWTPEIEARFDHLVRRRKSREPVAYLTGHKEFFSLDFFVTPAVLIPRPETETIVAAALEALAERPNARVLELGTGSGAIAVAIAHRAPLARVTAADVSPAALGVARRNADAHRLSDRIEFRLADLFEVRDGGPPFGGFDLIVSNPPYVAEAAIGWLEPEVRAFEPRLALAAGPDGLEFHRRIASGARAHLEPGGAAMVEIGAGQAAAVAGLFARADLTTVSVLDDLAGHPRVVRARRPAQA